MLTYHWHSAPFSPTPESDSNVTLVFRPCRNTGNKHRDKYLYKHLQTMHRITTNFINLLWMAILSGIQYCVAVDTRVLLCGSKNELATVTPENSHHHINHIVSYHIVSYHNHITHVSLSPSSITWYRGQGQWSFLAQKASWWTDRK